MAAAFAAWHEPYKAYAPAKTPDAVLLKGLVFEGFRGQ